jgi:hypothetical protein
MAALWRARGAHELADIEVYALLSWLMVIGGIATSQGDRS